MTALPVRVFDPIICCGVQWRGRGDGETETTSRLYPGRRCRTRRKKNFFALRPIVSTVEACGS